jgi:phasin
LAFLENSFGAAIYDDPTSARCRFRKSVTEHALATRAMMDSRPRRQRQSRPRQTDATQAFRETAEPATHRPKRPHECVAAADATTLMKDSYSKTIKGAQEYNTKVVEFAQANTKAAFDFAQELVGVKSPSEFFELSTNHSRKQFETLTEQAKELAMLAQKVTLATAEPIKSGATKAFSQLS